MHFFKTNIAALVGAAIFLAASAQFPKASAAEFEASPVTSGFWIWPRIKPKDASEIAATCRASLSVVLRDGRYLGVAPAGAAGDHRLSWRLTERGQCHFDRGKQTEHCDLTVLDDDGTSSSGYLTTTYLVENDGGLKGTVEGVGIEGEKKGLHENFEIYPTRCPDDAVFDAMQSIFTKP